eukprot:1632750-Pleurochrysis_carterae.AAC.2
MTHAAADSEPAEFEPQYEQPIAIWSKSSTECERPHRSLRQGAPDLEVDKVTDEDEERKRSVDECGLRAGDGLRASLRAQACVVVVVGLGVPLGELRPLLRSGAL